jgi:hypothetical protein
VYVRSGGAWSQQQRLVASDRGSGDYFGYSVSISGDTLVVGSYGDDIGVNYDQGSAYVYMRSGSAWSQQRKLMASDGASGDNFGFSVSVFGDTVAVGSNYDDVGLNNDQGSSYLYTRSGTTWNQLRKITSLDGDISDNFGSSVAVTGDTLVTGSNLDNVSTRSDQGSACIQNYTSDVATVTVNVIAANTAPTDLVLSNNYLQENLPAGYPVGVFSTTDVDVGNTFTYSLVSGVGDTDNSFFSITGEVLKSSSLFDYESRNSYSVRVRSTDQGGLFFEKVFTVVVRDNVEVEAFNDSFNAMTGQNSSLGVLSNDSPTGDVSLLSYTAISPVGPSLLQNSDGTFTFNGNSAGSYTFDYTVTGRQSKVLASDGAGGDNFGYSVAISGNTVVVGSNYDTVGSNSYQGSAYVYVYSGSGWVLQQKLTAADGSYGDYFGTSVAIFGDTIVVGSYGDDIGVNYDQGSAYVYVRSGSTWSQQQKLVALDGSSYDYFGSSVSVSVDTVVVGSYGDDMGSVSDQGSAYV